MDMHVVRRTPKAAVICNTCMDYRSRQLRSSQPTLRTAQCDGAWSLCRSHSMLGLITWGKITPVAEFLAAHGVAPTTPPVKTGEGGT
jgi:hypothetical protein